MKSVFSVGSLLFVVRRCATFMETLRLYNFCNFAATLLGFGTVFTNIILLWIRNFEKNRTTPTPQKNKQGHRHKLRALVKENVKTCENL